MRHKACEVASQRRGAVFAKRAEAGARARAQTRLMAQEKGESAVRYRGLLDALVRIPREEGVAALWRGLLPRLMRIPPGQARPLAFAYLPLALYP